MIQQQSNLVLSKLAISLSFAQTLTQAFQTEVVQKATESTSGKILIFYTLFIDPIFKTS